MRIVLVVLLLAACDKAPASGPQGKERGDCYGNGTCDVGLTCLSNLCVRPPPADCAPVAQKLASYRLGNYAPREERDKVVGELTAACEAAMLSVEEGKCITDATSRYEVAKCPRPLLAELQGDADGCKGVGETMAKALLDGFATSPEQKRAAEPLIPELTAALTSSCVEDLWPDAAKQCVMSAKDFQAMGNCDDAFGKDAFDRIGKRLMPVLEKIMAVITGAGPDAAPLPPPPPPLVDAGVAGTQPSTGASMFEQTCSGYVAAMETYLKCDKFPDEARKAARDALDQMKKSFDQMGGGQSPDVVKSMADACKQGEAAIADAIKALGC
jgi:hypothetical protein